MLIPEIERAVIQARVRELKPSPMLLALSQNWTEAGIEIFIDAIEEAGLNVDLYQLRPIDNEYCRERLIAVREALRGAAIINPPKRQCVRVNGVGIMMGKVDRILARNNEFTESGYRGPPDQEVRIVDVQLIGHVSYGDAIPMMSVVHVHEDTPSSNRTIVSGLVLGIGWHSDLHTFGPFRSAAMREQERMSVDLVLRSTT